MSQFRKSFGLVLQLTEHRDGMPDTWVKVRVRPLPISSEEAVGAIVWDWNCLDYGVSQFLPQVRDSRHRESINLRNFRKVIIHQPEKRRRVGVVRQHNHGLS